jgi:TM2 domain-containing membrane protein YozV
MGTNLTGQVLGFNPQEKKGIIKGEDGHRYEFDLSEWKEGELPKKGDRVDFELDETGKVKNIYYALDINNELQSKRSRLIATLLAIFLGWLGAHKFYLGCNKAGIIMALVSVLGFVVVIPTLLMILISWIEGIIYLTKPYEEFEEIYIKNKRCWL